MEILLLGTGAADGIPAFFGEDRVSRMARERGGREVRSRSAALIDGHLKVDLGPETWVQCAREGVTARDWSAVIFTHSHDDHITGSELQYALYPFTADLFAPFTVFGNAAIEARLAARYPEWPIEFIRIGSFEPFPHAGYTVTPIAAHHKLDEDSLNLIFDDGERRFLYATDTGYWQEQTWEFLAGQRLDGLVIECTEGRFRTAYHGHVDLAECLKMVERLRSMGVLLEGAQVVTTHHAAAGDLTHEELVAALAPFGIVPGYDGMRIQL